MELTKKKYFSICKESGFVGAKNYPEVNKVNFYLPIEAAPCFLHQEDALAFSWFCDSCYSHFEHDDWPIVKLSTVEELLDEIERCKDLYEQKCKNAMKKMIEMKKNEIQKASEEFET